MARGLGAVRVVERFVCLMDVPFLGGRIPKERPRRVVYVCTGNICRSAYAEALTRSLGIQVTSAGVDTTPGLPAHPQTVVEAARRGLDLTLHRTRTWSDLELRRGDVIVAAQVRHAVSVYSRATEHGCPIVLMSRLVGPPFETVRDPYGQPARVFEAVFDVIDTAVRNLRILWWPELVG